MAVRSMELLRGLDANQRAAVTALAEQIRLSAGDVLFRLGDEAEWLYAIEWGRIQLTLPMHVRGRDEDVLVEERRPGEIVGWSAVIPPHHVTFTATAMTETELVAFPREPLTALLTTRPDIGAELLRTIAMVIGHRLQVVQAMWLREMQRFVSAAHG
jgi:CRP-like cAMP-binding protein